MPQRKIWDGKKGIAIIGSGRNLQQEFRDLMMTDHLKNPLVTPTSIDDLDLDHSVRKALSEHTAIIKRVKHIEHTEYPLVTLTSSNHTEREWVDPNEEVHNLEKHRITCTKNRAKRKKKNKRNKRR